MLTAICTLSKSLTSLPVTPSFISTYFSLKSDIPSMCGWENWDVAPR